jgi:hypothetical protein
MSLYSDFVVNIVRVTYFAGVSGDYALDKMHQGWQSRL